VVGRWRAVALAALEQSRGAHLTEVADCSTTARLAELTSGLRLVAVPGSPPLPDVLQRGQPAQRHSTQADGERTSDEDVWVAIGPEGGWSDAEVELLLGSGWLAIGLGASVLRTEHAGPVALAVIAALAGHWREATRDRGVQGR
jgi:16S rRNA (uracil1498-N3)-methyltransferase